MSTIFETVLEIERISVFHSKNYFCLKCNKKNICNDLVPVHVKIQNKNIDFCLNFADIIYMALNFKIQRHILNILVLYIFTYRKKNYFVLNKFK